MSERVEIKYCRYCGQLIALTTVECPYCSRATIKGEDKKQCPFCGELIRAKAIKCKHCGEFVDARAASGRASQVVNIEKAIITAAGPEGEVGLYRPDGERISLKPSEAARLREGRERTKALPEGRPSGEPSRPLPQRREATVPAGPSAEAPAVPAPSRPEGSVSEAAVVRPEAQSACPICGRILYEGDRFCENCGRDLSVPKGQRQIAVQSKPYGPADYALMVSAAAPVGLFLRFPFSGLVGGAGAVMGLWCLLRILFSGGRFRGAERAAGAIALGLFWIALIYWGMA